MLECVCVGRGMSGWEVEDPTNRYHQKGLSANHKTSCNVLCNQQLESDKFGGIPFERWIDMISEKPKTN